MIANVAEKVRPYTIKTPVLISEELNQTYQAELFFKCENLQKTGSFKMRGATNALLNLSDEQKKKGVVTHSSGNFAQALALSAKQIGIPAYIVMPSSAPQIKIDRTNKIGAHVTICDATLEAREQAAEEIQQKTGATFIHPSDNIDVIQGQGTSALELLDDHPELEYIFCPVGGGGLVGGTILANKEIGKAKIIGGEPALYDDAYRSLESREIEVNTNNPTTLADGLKTKLGVHNFPIILEGIDHINLVSEIEILEAMKKLWENLKITVEGSSAVAFAAFIKEHEVLKGKKIGIILSGGNVDLEKLPFCS